MKGQQRDTVRPGLTVKIVLKQDQRTGKRTRSIVKDVLTEFPEHPHGIKVRMERERWGESKRLSKKAKWLIPGDY